MTDVGGGSAGSGAHRIGDAERQAAVQALNVHRESGRLDAVEFEDRQVRVVRARTWADIQAAFDDLPPPHPAGMPAPVGAAGALAPSGVGGQVVQPSGEGTGLLGNIIPEQYRSTVMALTPFAALLLWWVTRTWVWFLAIPIMGILLYGADAQEDHKRQERLAREERRRLERERRQVERERRRRR